MIKRNVSQKIRRTTLDNITRIAAEGLRVGNQSADILIAILASIHGEAPAAKKAAKVTKSATGATKRKYTKRAKKKSGAVKSMKSAKSVKSAKTKKKATVVGKAPHGYIKQAIQDGLTQGKSNKEILVGIKALYPGVKTTVGNISWYKSQYLTKKAS